MEIDQSELVAGATSLMYAIVHKMHKEPKVKQVETFFHGMKNWMDSEMAFLNWWFAIGEDDKRISDFFRGCKQMVEEGE